MEGMHRPADTPHTFRVRLLPLKMLAKTANLFGSFPNSEDPGEDSHLCWGGEAEFCNTSHWTPTFPSKFRHWSSNSRNARACLYQNIRVWQSWWSPNNDVRWLWSNPTAVLLGRGDWDTQKYWGYTEKKDHVRTWWDEVIGKPGERDPRRDQTCWLLDLGLEPAKR